MSENDVQQPDRYMKLLSLDNAEQAYREVKKLASDLTDDEHLIRSCIFDLHAAVETELRRVYYHHFKSLLAFTDDEISNKKCLKTLSDTVGRLGFMEMYRVLGPVLKSWPYPDLDSIPAINETRNRAAHTGKINEVEYKGRNPFKDPDCFAQMYFDVWAITQSMTKFFNRTIEEPLWRLRKYREKYGDL